MVPTFAINVLMTVKSLVIFNVVVKFKLYQFIPVEDVVVAPAALLPFVLNIVVAVETNNVEVPVLVVPCT